MWVVDDGIAKGIAARYEAFETSTLVQADRLLGYPNRLQTLLSPDPLYEALSSFADLKLARCVSKHHNSQA